MQIFSKKTNIYSRLVVLGLVVLALSVATLGITVFISPWYSRVNTVQPQPVPFSHEHHVTGLGIDCRYCHNFVEKSAFAGIPTAKTCMTCHSQIWTNAEMLEPVREAYRTGKPIQWTKLHNLPDYVYFNHSAHVAKGVACITCHGPVDKMPLMYQAKNMTMMWCLECHRNPAKYIQPKETVFEVTDDWKKHKELMDRYTKDNPSKSLGQCLVENYKVKGKIKMADCYTCHR